MAEEECGLLKDKTRDKEVLKDKKRRITAVVTLVIAIVAVVLLLCVSFGVGLVLGWKLLPNDSSSRGGEQIVQTYDYWGGTVTDSGNNVTINQWITGKIIAENIRNNLK